MGALLKYLIEVECETPPAILLGQNLFGGKVTALKVEDVPKLVTVSWLVERYGLSKATIIKRLEGCNQGTGGKHLYEAKVAMLVLTNSQKSKRGPKRVN